jgi:prepilin-type N-terminal cleavage/methylation domain-containing protein
MHVSFRKGFTLIELLVVIAIIAILAVVVVLTLNPIELLRQARDANRLSDMSTLVHAIGLYQEDLSAGSLGSASTTYISVPDSSATSTAGDQCQGLGMTTSSAFTWHCAASSTYRDVNGNGWLPINFTNMSTGAPLGSLPVDPTNQTSSGLYYSYATNGTTFELSALPESQKYTALAEANPNMFTAGSNTSLLTAGGIANGSVSQVSMRLSTINGTAFVDFGVARSLTPYIGDQLTITDSTGHQLIGWIKAAGTGETYGSQLLPDPGMDNLSDFWSQNATLSIFSTSSCQSGGCLQVAATTAYGNADQDFTLSEGMLVRNSVYMKDGTETAWMWWGINDPSYVAMTGGNNYVLPTSWTQYVRNTIPTI